MNCNLEVVLDKMLIFNIAPFSFDFEFLRNSRTTPDRHPAFLA